MRGTPGSPRPEATAAPDGTAAPQPKSWFTASDEELIRATSRGRGEAFDELLARHGKPAFVFINRLLAGRHEAEDLLQETFMRVVQHASEFRAGAPFKPWLYTIARNVAYNALKKTGRREGLEVKTDLSDWEPAARGSGAVDPSIRLEQDEQKRKLLEALERLPQAHREILVLTIFEGFSYDEAAEITGDPVGTLRSRVFHALKKLREILKERP